MEENAHVSKRRAQKPERPSWKLFLWTALAGLVFGLIGFGEIARTAVSRYPRRTVLGLSLFVGQAFLYNAVFFTYALVQSAVSFVPSRS